MGLILPVEPRFVLGAVSLEFDRAADRFALNLRDVNAEVDDETEDAETDDEESPDSYVGMSVRIVMTRAQAMAFCEQTARVVEAGRPDCEYCARPIDPDGHFCPRMN